MRFGIVFALLCAAVAQGQLAPTGTLRAVFLQTNPVQGRVDATTGAVSGPAADLTRELGRQLGVSVSITPVSGPKAVIESLKNHTADIGFLAYDTTRAAEVDFSHVYAFSWSSYIVPANSPLQAVADVDRKGIRIGSTAGDSPYLFLSRNLKNAELKSYGSLPPDEVLRMLASGEIDVWAANRQRLIEMAANDKSVRVLRDNFFAVQQSIAVAKGDSVALDTVNRFIEAARTSGVIKRAIIAAGLGRSVDVAPGR